MNKPPYQITSRILHSISTINEKLGAAVSRRLDAPSAQLQKRNRIRVIQGSLSIEGNTLTEEQITAVLDGAHVVGPAKDILEAQNAALVYDQLENWNPWTIESMCKAHGILMKGLVQNPGKLRTKSVGIVKNGRVTHLAPDASIVSPLLKNLLLYVKNDTDPLLLKSCVFHYEFEFIHPFADGNGRMGRLWQSLLLCRLSPAFALLPVESLINAQRSHYYQALATSDKDGNATAFIEFMLDMIDGALGELLRSGPVTFDGRQRLEHFAREIGVQAFSRKDYMAHFPELSSATASRDLATGVNDGRLQRSGNRRTAQYRFRK